MKSNFAFLSLALAAVIAAAPAVAQTNAGQQPVVVYDLDSLQKNTVPVVIAGDPALTALAHKAFQSHGRYSRVASGGDYTFTFTQVSPTQVRVDIAKKGAPTITNITASGANTHDALYRAADAAVKNSGGGNGYFTSKLAFVSNATGADEIYVSDLFLQGARAITNKRASILMPRWSPDGRRIIFTSFYKSGSADIFQIDANTGHLTDYARYQGMNMGGRYSPDGSRVAMVISPPNGNMNIYLGTPDGRTKPASITNSREGKASPCFSPDGQRIVFAMEPGPQLYLMPAGGGAPTRLVTGVNYAAEPDWSRANPNLIVFSTNKTIIGIHDLSTGKTRFITPKNASGKAIGGDFVEPSWLPDGRHIVCTQRTAAHRYLYIVDTEEKSDNRATQISAVYARQASVHPQP